MRRLLHREGRPIFEAKVPYPGVADSRGVSSGAVPNPRTDGGIRKKQGKERVKAAKPTSSKKYIVQKREYCSGFELFVSATG